MRTFTFTRYYKSISIKIIIIHLVCKKQFINEELNLLRTVRLLFTIKYPQYFFTVVFIIIFLLAKIRFYFHLFFVFVAVLKCTGIANVFFEISFNFESKEKMFSAHYIYFLLFIYWIEIFCLVFFFLLFDLSKWKNNNIWYKKSRFQLFSEFSIQILILTLSSCIHRKNWLLNEIDTTVNASPTKQQMIPWRSHFNSNELSAMKIYRFT